MPYQPRNHQQADADRAHRELGGTAVPLRVDWANRLGSIHAALVLQQLMFEARHHADEDGWFFVTAEDMQEHTAVGARAYHTARGVLEQAGIIQSKRAGVPAKTYVRFNWDRFTAWRRNGDDLPTPMPADLDAATAETSFDDRSNKTLRPQQLLRESHTRDQNESALGDMPQEQDAHAAKPTPLPDTAPEQQIVKAFCDTIGLAQPPAYGKAIGQAKSLIKAGIAPTEIPEMVRWAQGQWFGRNGIGLADLVRFADQYRSAHPKGQSSGAWLSQEELRQFEKKDWQYGVYEIGYTGYQAWRRDREAGTLPQLDGRRNP